MGAKVRCAGGVLRACTRTTLPPAGTGSGSLMVVLVVHLQGFTPLPDERAGECQAAASAKKTT